MTSVNFDFLKVHERQLVRFGVQAERYSREDPNACLIKLCRFGEVLAQLTIAKTGLFSSADERQADLRWGLQFERAISGETGKFFHKLRLTGNRATHSLAGDHADAQTNPKIAHALGAGFHRTFVDPKFRPSPFIPPPDSAAATNACSRSLNVSAGLPL